MSDFSEQYFLKLKKHPPHLHTTGDASQPGSGQLQNYECCSEVATQLLWPELKGSTVAGISARGNI